MDRGTFKQLFSVKLKKLLKSRKITQAELAAICGLSLAGFKRQIHIDDHTMPDIYALYLMCETFELDPDELLSMERRKEKTLADFTTDELLTELKRRTEAP